MATSIIKGNVRFATERGTNNSWGYVKYSDGTYEAWRTYSGTQALTSQSAGTYYAASDISIPLPSFSTSITIAQATATSPLASGVFVYKFEGFVSNALLSFRSFVSIASANVGAYLYIRGTY